MKLFILSVLIIISNIFIGCSGTTGTKENSINENTDINAILQFEKIEHDFGKIFQGEKVSYIFKFKNIGSGDLIIQNATASCGCTVPKYPRKPIASGESGEIEVIFDSSNRHGKQVKNVTVWSNSKPDKIELQIISEIVELN